MDQRLVDLVNGHHDFSDDSGVIFDYITNSYQIRHSFWGQGCALGGTARWVGTLGEVRESIKKNSPNLTDTIPFSDLPESTQITLLETAIRYATPEHRAQVWQMIGAAMGRCEEGEATHV